MQAVWAVFVDPTIIKTGATTASITGSGKVASPLRHTERHVRNLIVALGNAKYDVLDKAFRVQSARSPRRSPRQRVSTTSYVRQGC